VCRALPDRAAPGRALALASSLLAHGGYALLQERLKAMEK